MSAQWPQVIGRWPPDSLSYRPGPLPPVRLSTPIIRNVFLSGTLADPPSSGSMILSALSVGSCAGLNASQRQLLASQAQLEVRFESAVVPELEQLLKGSSVSLLVDVEAANNAPAQATVRRVFWTA